MAQAPLRAVVDIGTNSILLLVARRGPDGAVEILEDTARVARLGEGVAQSGALLPRAVDRAIGILETYRDHVRELGAELVVVATAGIRMANNPELFLDRAAVLLGQPVRVISGEEEARLSYLSVARETDDGTLRVLDIGGGSTELVTGRGEEVDGFVSHPMGSVRLTEQFVRNDPPTGAEVQHIASAADACLASQPLPSHPVLHGLAGTVTSAAAIHLGLQTYDRAAVDGTRMTHDEVGALRDRLARQTRDERIATTLLGEGRADVIVAGMTVLLRTMVHCGAQTLVVRDRGLRYALV